MIPKTLSASSLQVFALCPSRWEAQYIERAPEMSGKAAMTGTSCHYAFEKWVEACYINKTHEPTMELLLQFYQIGYIETFASADFDTPEYLDGQEMVVKWFKRTRFDSTFTVETVEVKETIQVPYIDRTTNDVAYLPFNYIIDRVDQTGPTTWRVVDYKSQRKPITFEELEHKIQARAYALAIQIKHPEATEIRVVMDLLRHDEIGLKFTRDDNIRFWNFLKAETQRIVDTPSNPAPTLNMECGYCPRLATCEVVQQNIASGGIHGLTLDEQALLKLQIEHQMKANKILLEKLEESLLIAADAKQELDWETEDGQYTVELGFSRRRQVDASLVAQIIGPEIFAQLGSITLGKLDDLIKDMSLPQELREQLKSLIYFKTGDPKVYVKKKAVKI